MQLIRFFLGLILDILQFDNFMSRYRTLFCCFGVHFVHVELSRPNITSSVKFCSNMVQLGGHVGNGGIALVTCPRSHLDPSSALRPLFLSLLFSEHPHSPRTCSVSQVGSCSGRVHLGDHVGIISVALVTVPGVVWTQAQLSSGELY